MYGSIMRAKIVPGRREEYLAFMRDIAPLHQARERGMHSLEIGFEDRDPNAIVMIIRFRDRASYIRNADDPETDRQYRQQLEFFEEEPTWIDVNYSAFLGDSLSETAGVSLV
jgi:quinol monooxygenase YgiN